MGRKRLTDEERLEIALVALKGEEISSICSKYQISQALVYKIKDKAEEGLRGVMRRGAGRNLPLKRLEKENAKLKELVADYVVAVEVLKKKRKGRTL